MKEILLALFGATAQLLGIVIALIALAPAVLQMAVAGSSEIEKKRAQRSTRTELTNLVRLMWILSAAAILSLVGLCNEIGGYIAIALTVVAILGLSLTAKKLVHSLREQDAL
jgi:hypothetical protein